MTVTAIITIYEAKPTETKKAYFLYKQQDSSESESCSISYVRTQYGRTTLSPRRSANHLIYLQLRTQLRKDKRPPEPIPTAFQVVAPHSGQSSQLFLVTTEMPCLVHDSTA